MTTTNLTTGTLPQRPTASGMGWRVAVSITSLFGWVSFLLLFWAFWSGIFNTLQTVVVLAVSLLAFIAVNGATWGSWGTRSIPASGA